MKVVGFSDGGSKKPAVLLPLTEDLGLYQLDKTNSVTWELRTVPTDANSPKYKLQVRVLQGDEDPRQMVRWRLDVAKVITGLNISTIEAMQPVHEACMRTGPLASYNTGVLARTEVLFEQAKQTAIAADTARGDGLTTAIDGVNAQGRAHYLDCPCLVHGIDCVLINHMPRKILQKVKRSLRREMRKPADMLVRTYYQHILRLNNEEMPNLPPFGANQQLGNDELLDIILFGTPRSWQNEMDKQGFDPMDRHLYEVIDFMENIESTEVKPSASTDKSSSKGKKDNKKSSSSSSSGKKKAPYYCKHHGPNSSHNTEDCLVLKNQKPSGGSSDKKKSYGNKTWSRKAQEANAASKKELAAFVTKQVKKGVKKQLASTSKKRKSDDSDSDDSDKDCFLVESLTKNLDGFNYETMENLSIDDDITDEISV